MLKRKVIIIVLLFMILCQGCGKNNLQKEQQEVFASIFDGKENTLVNEKKMIDGLTITVNHVAFEEHCFMIDYTMEAEEISVYSDVSVRFVGGQFDNDGGIGVTVEENEKTLRQICFYDLDGEGLSEKDLGEEVEVEFYSVSGLSKLGYEENAVFSLEISEIYSPKSVSVAEDISYEGGNAVIEELIISPFYTKLVIDDENSNNFANGFYSYELTSGDENILYWLGGSGEEYIYSPLPEDSQEIGITVIKYSKDADYDYVSDKLRVKY